MIWSVIDRNSNFVWSRPKDMAKAYCRLSFTRVVYCETFFWLFFWHFEQMATNAQWGWIFFWVAFFFSCTCYFITYLSKICAKNIKQNENVASEKISTHWEMLQGDFILTVFLAHRARPRQSNCISYSNTICTL